MAKHRNLKVPEIPLKEGLTTQENVYERLRHAIMIGAFPPGTTLTMRGLAETLNLSPTPVREALRRLSSEHAIEIMQNRRMLIPKMTLGRFEELVSLRIAVEVHAAERALPYVSDIIIQKMEAVDIEMDQAISVNDMDLLTILNQRFHQILYSVNPNQISIPVINSLWLQLGPFQRQVLTKLEEFYKIDRHKEIIAALRTRDAAALVNATESDIRDGMRRSGRQLLTEMASDNKAA